MATIHVVYDPSGKLRFDPGLPPFLKRAQLDVPEGLTGLDIYEVARKLAELLFEQVQRGPEESR